MNNVGLETDCRLSMQQLAELSLAMSRLLQSIDDVSTLIHTIMQQVSDKSIVGKASTA